MPRESIMPRLQHEVAIAILEGQEINEVNEAIIEPSGLADDAKAALWLYAWSLQDPEHARAQASQYLAETIPSGD